MGVCVFGVYKLIFGEYLLFSYCIECFLCFVLFLFFVKEVLLLLIYRGINWGWELLGNLFKVCG